MKRETKSVTLDLVLKAAEGQRRFKGIATTPSPDRHGEVIRPEGAEYALPLVLLAFHQSQKPIGTVDTVRVTSAGIEVECQFVPEGVDAEADRCYGLALAGALKGLSVGFLPIESEIDGEGRVVYTKWSWLELSLVAIGSNPDGRVLQVKEKEVKPKAKVQSQETEVEQVEEQEEAEQEVESPKPKGQVRKLGGAPAVHTKEREYSLARVVRAINGDRWVDIGLEIETHQEMERTQKVKDGGFLVPLTHFRTKAHDAITASPDTGKSLAGEDRRGDLLLQVDDAILRPPIADRLGVTMISTNEDKVIIPKQTKALVASWMARDGTASASSDAEFTSVNLQPTTLNILFEMKRSLVYATHPSAMALLMADARRAIDLALDNAVLSGSGASNQPLGFKTSGGSTATGVSGAISASNASTHPRKIRNELEAYLKEADPSLKWVLHPLVVGMLKLAPAFTGATGDTVIPAEGTKLADREFVETYALGDPAGGPPLVCTGLIGDYSEMVACTFGPAMELVANPYADSVFAKGSTLIRGLLDYNQLHRDIKRVLRFTSEGLT